MDSPILDIRRAMYLGDYWVTVDGARIYAIFQPMTLSSDILRPLSKYLFNKYVEFQPIDDHGWFGYCSWYETQRRVRIRARKNGEKTACS